MRGEGSGLRRSPQGRCSRISGVLTGGKAIFEETGIKLEAFVSRISAKAKRVNVDKDNTPRLSTAAANSEEHRSADQTASRADRGDHFGLRSREAPGAPGEARGRRVAVDQKWRGDRDRDEREEGSRRRCAACDARGRWKREDRSPGRRALLRAAAGAREPSRRDGRTDRR